MMVVMQCQMMTMVAAMRTVVVVVSNGDDGSGNEGGELIDDEDDGREGGGVDDGGEAPVVKMGKRVEDGDVLPKEGCDVRRRTARQKEKRRCGSCRQLHTRQKE